MAAELHAHGLQLWPVESGNGYLGLLAMPDSGAVRGTVIVFHGNAGTALDRHNYLPRGPWLLWIGVLRPKQI